MPEIKLKTLLSFSSEDEFYPAKNLFKGSSIYQWQCKSNSENLAYVEFQFESQCKITRIEIGNNNSAFIEIKVSRFPACDNYQVLLGSTSLMSPSEAIKCDNLKRVRCFKTSNFFPAVAAKQWDVIRLECTQPFNKTLQYGLSFIKCFTNSPDIVELHEEPKIIPVDRKIDISKFVTADLQEDQLRPGSLFQRNRLEKESSKQNQPYSVDKINLSDINSQMSLNEICPEKIHDEFKQSCFTDCENKVKLGLDQSIDSINKCQQIDSIKHKQNKVPLNHSIFTLQQKRKVTEYVQNDSPDWQGNLNKDDNASGPSECKKIRDDPKADSAINLKRIGSPLCDTPSVSLSTLSTNKNTQNDQVQSCSVSSFNDNFSKKMILKDVVFVLSGYQNPLRNTIRDKAMSLGAKYRPSWTDDCTHLICAFCNTPKFKEIWGKGIIVSEKWIFECYNQSKLLPWRNFRLKGAISPVKIVINNASDKGDCLEDRNLIGEDSPKLDLIIENEKPVNTSSTPVNNAFKSESFINIPDIFHGQHFFLYGDFEDQEFRFIKRFILTFGGIIHSNMSRDVNVVITNSFWDDNFDEALSSNPELKFILPSWLHRCDKDGSLVPFSEFEVTK